MMVLLLLLLFCAASLHAQFVVRFGDDGTEAVIIAPGDTARTVTLGVLVFTRSPNSIETASFVCGDTVYVGQGLVFTVNVGAPFPYIPDSAVVTCVQKTPSYALPSAYSSFIPSTVKLRVYNNSTCPGRQNVEYPFVPYNTQLHGVAIWSGPLTGTVRTATGLMYVWGSNERCGLGSASVLGGYNAAMVYHLLPLDIPIVPATFQQYANVSCAQASDMLSAVCWGSFAPLPESDIDCMTNPLTRWRISTGACDSVTFGITDTYIAALCDATLYLYGTSSYLFPPLSESQYSRRVPGLYYPLITISHSIFTEYELYAGRRNIVAFYNRTTADAIIIGDAVVSFCLNLGVIEWWASGLLQACIDVTPTYTRNSSTDALIYNITTNTLSDVAPLSTTEKCFFTLDGNVLCQAGYMSSPVPWYVDGPPVNYTDYIFTHNPNQTSYATVLGSLTIGKGVSCASTVYINNTESISSVGFFQTTAINNACIVSLYCSASQESIPSLANLSAAASLRSPDIKKLVAGNMHTCILRASSGAVYCTGMPINCAYLLFHGADTRTFNRLLFPTAADDIGAAGYVTAIVHANRTKCSIFGRLATMDFCSSLDCTADVPDPTQYTYTADVNASIVYLKVTRDLVCIEVIAQGNTTILCIGYFYNIDASYWRWSPIPVDPADRLRNVYVSSDDNATIVVSSGTEGVTRSDGCVIIRGAPSVICAGIPVAPIPGPADGTITTMIVPSLSSILLIRGTNFTYNGVFFNYTVTAAAAGIAHAMVVIQNSSVCCIGSTSNGQCGRPSTGYSEYATLVCNSVEGDSWSPVYVNETSGLLPSAYQEPQSIGNTVLKTHSSMFLAIGFLYVVVICTVMGVLLLIYMV